jgi:hypothetical protein
MVAPTTLHLWEHPEVQNRLHILRARARQSSDLLYVYSLSPRKKASETCSTCIYLASYATSPLRV